MLLSWSSWDHPWKIYSKSVGRDFHWKQVHLCDPKYLRSWLFWIVVGLLFFADEIPLMNLKLYEVNSVKRSDDLRRNLRMRIGIAYHAISDLLEFVVNGSWYSIVRVVFWIMLGMIECVGYKHWVTPLRILKSFNERWRIYFRWVY